MSSPPHPDPLPRWGEGNKIWLVVALAVFGAGLLYSRMRPEPRPSWQRRVSELTDSQQKFYAQLRTQLRSAEQVRSAKKIWPPAAGLFPEGWALLAQRSTINYVGEGEGLRWLVLFLEPDPRAAPEKAPPEDDEHHTLGDGTALHVTVWTQPISELSTPLVTAFPATEGWVERVAR